MAKEAYRAYFARKKEEKNMKAGVVHGVCDIRYEDINTPKVEPGKVLVKVKYTGICGSDIPRVNADAAHYYPIVL